MTTRPRLGVAAVWLATSGKYVPFAAYFLLFGAWALAMPYNGPPDEMAHIWHGYAAASGHLLPEIDPGHGALELVPQSLPGDACFFGHPWLTAACSPPPGGDQTLVSVSNAAGRYNPLYYIAVGWPLVISPDMTGVLAARLVSAALCAALFGWATIVALSLRKRGALAGLVVALTPTTAHLAGAINPNGIEIAAGAGLIMALIAILLEPDAAGARRSVWWLAGISGGVMLTVRALGPLWFATTVIIMLVPLGLTRYRTLARSRRTWWLVGSWAVIGLAGAGWTLWRRTYEIIGGPPPQPMSLGNILKNQVLIQFTPTLKEIVGVLGWLDTDVPILVHLAWWLSIGLLVLLALAFGRSADRWWVGGLAALGFAVPILLESSQVNKFGFPLQGRYLLPMLVGVPILAGYVLAERIPFEMAPRLTRLFAILLLPAELFSLFYTMIRYQRGLPADGVPTFNVFGGQWQPLVSPVVPLAMAMLSVVVFLLYYRRVTSSTASELTGPYSQATFGLRDSVPELVGARATSPSRDDEGST